MHIVCSYNGASNLDETLDDNISYLMGKYFYDNNMDFEILDMDFVSPKPEINDELVRYHVEIGIQQDKFNSDWIRKALENEGFGNGLTIKSIHGKILFADSSTADIQYRRRIKNIKRVD